MRRPRSRLARAAQRERSRHGRGAVRRDAVPARAPHAQRAARRCRGLSRLRPVAAGDADGVRRGAEGRDVRPRRRGAGRPRGPRRAAVRRAGGPRARRGARGGRHRPRRGLRHERRQALPLRGARQAAHPPEARRQAGQGLQSVAALRARPPAPRGARAARRDRGEVAAGQRLQAHGRARPAAGLRPRAGRHRHDPSLVDPARPRRRGAPGPARHAGRGPARRPLRRSRPARAEPRSPSAAAP